MDEVERKRFLDILRRDDDFRATVRRELLTEELLNLPQTVATLVDVVAQQRQDFTTLATDVRDYMERTITLIGEGFTVVSTELSGQRTGFTAVDARFDQVTGEISGLGGEISGLRNGLIAEISELRADTAAGFAAVDARFDQVNTDIRGIKDRLAS